MFNRKKAMISLGVIISSSLPISALSCNMSANYKPTFYNYEDYMSKMGVDSVSSKFNFKQFGDLPEFEHALIEKRTVGGIGSDYYNAKWAARGLIKKIDFKRALGIEYKDRNDLKNKLKNIGYTKQTWKQMESFNEYLAINKVDSDNDGLYDELWEFMIPYFIQSKVLAFNLARGNNDWERKVKVINNQAGIDALFPDKSYLGMLKTLRKNGYENFVVNDYSRDNMMIGSELSGKFTGNLTEDNYKEHIDGYINTLKQGLDLDVKNGNDVIFETSGTGSLDHLVNPKEKWSSSFLYNGDALFAHFGGSDETSQGKNIRIVTPDNPTFLLDGLVLSSIADKDWEDRFYNVAYNGFLKGWSDTLDKNFKLSNAYNGDFPPAAINFDSVNYTTPFKSVYNHFKKGGSDDYFVGELPGEYDTFGEEIFHVAPISKMSKSTIIYPITDELQYKYSKYYISKTS